MSLKQLLKPTKEKIIVDLLFVLVQLALVLSLPSLGYQKQLFSLGLISMIFEIILTVLLGLIIYYPFACGIVFIYNIFVGKEKKSEKKDLTFAILMILIFNPLIYSLVIQGIVSFNHNVINRPCDIEITGFAENSPAKNAGMTIGEIILSIDNNQIDTLDSLTHAMANKRPGEDISITTNIGNYKFQTTENPTTPASAFIGIKINQKYCER